MKILIAYDGSNSADIAIDDLRYAGLPEKAEVLLFCAQDGGLLAEAVALIERAGERVRSYFPKWDVAMAAQWGSPANVILEKARAWHPDLIVLGSHGRSRTARLLLGSVSTEVLHKAPGSVRVGRVDGSRGAKPPRIIAAIDGSPNSETVIRAIAGRHWPKDTEVLVLSVMESLVPAPQRVTASTFAEEPAFSVIAGMDEDERDRLHDEIEYSAGVLRHAGLIVSASVPEGSATEQIVSEADRWNADAIFIGARGLGAIERLLLGSVSTHVVTHAHCSVEVVR